MNEVTLYLSLILPFTKGRQNITESMMLKFVLLVNKQGQTRLSQYYSYVPVEERVATEADIVRKCLSRSEEAVSYLKARTSIFRLFLFHVQCSFMEYKNFKVVYRRYASLYFIIGIDSGEVIGVGCGEFSGTVKIFDLVRWSLGCTLIYLLLDCFVLTFNLYHTPKFEGTS